MPRTNTTTVLGIAVIIALSAMGVYWFVFHSILVNGRTTAELRSRVQQNARDIAQLSALEHLVDETAGDHGELQSRFVTTDTIAPFLEMLGTAIRALHATPDITSVDVVQGAGSGKKSTTASSIPAQLHIALRATGSYQSVFSVLTMLETLPYRTRIERAALESKDGTSTPQWVGTFTVSIATLP